jgi:hypothetical protein
MQLSTLNTVMELLFTLSFWHKKCIDFMKTDHAELMYVSYNLQ